MSEIFRYRDHWLVIQRNHKIVEIACVQTTELIPNNRIFHKIINPERVCTRRGF